MCRRKVYPGGLQPVKSGLLEEYLRSPYAGLACVDASAPHRFANGCADGLGSIYLWDFRQSWRRLTSNGMCSAAHCEKDGRVALGEGCQAAAVREAVAPDPRRFQQPAVPALPQHRRVVKYEGLLGVVRPEAADVPALTGLESSAQLAELCAEG